MQFDLEAFMGLSNSLKRLATPGELRYRQQANSHRSELSSLCITKCDSGFLELSLAASPRSKMLSQSMVAPTHWLSDLSSLNSHQSRRALASPNKPGVAILGKSSLSTSWIVEACRTCEFRFQDFASLTSIAENSPTLGLRLAIVHQNASRMPYRTIVENLQAAGFSRVVLVGPKIGSKEFISALDVGFDEVWPAAINFDLTCALLHKALHTASKLSAYESLPVPSIGALSIDQDNHSCTFDGNTIFPGREALILLSNLFAAYPKTAWREDLDRALGRSCAEGMRQSRAVDMAVLRLRKKLKEFTGGQLKILTVTGIGYRLAMSKVEHEMADEIVSSGTLP